MATSIRIEVNPAVLKWARESAGVGIEDAARRLKMPAAEVSRSESQATVFTLSQLRELASYFKRPLAAFLLPAPPREPSPPQDFRTLPHSRDVFDRNTRLAIRKALRLRSVAKDLMRAVGRNTASQLASANVSEEPEPLIRQERDRLGISVETQRKWKDEREAFREWRAAIERQNLLVFQLPMPVEDARGFSLTEDEPYAIVVSSSDAVRGRIFTLFHEYAHLLLRTSGICLPQIHRTPRKGGADLERWCNQFAGAFLVPATEVSSLVRAGPKELTGQAILDAAQVIATQFKVSDQVALWRLRDLGKVSQRSFQQTMKQYAARTRGIKKPGGPVAPAKRCIVQNGTLFTSLVIEARGRGLVSYSDVADYLGVGLKHLPEIESSLAAVAA